MYFFWRHLGQFAETVPSYSAIWDEFSKQHWHQSIKKGTIFNAQLALFNANKVHI